MEKKLKSTITFISTEDKLPEVGNRYLCRVLELNDLGTSYYIWNCYYNHETKEFSDGFGNVQVTHWAELPSILEEDLEGEIVEIQDDGFGSLIKRASKLTENTKDEIISQVKGFVKNNHILSGSLKVHTGDWVCELTTGELIVLPDSLFNYIQKLENELYDFRKEKENKRTREESFDQMFIEGSKIL